MEDDRFDRAHYEAVFALDEAYVTESRDLVDAYVEGFMSSLGSPRADEVAHSVEGAFLDPWSRTIDGSVQAMRTLNELGHPIAIVSNSLGHVEEGLRGICQVGAGPGATVACIIDSYHVGVEKPDPRIFEIALEAVGGEREAVHVGDSVVYDVRGAEAAGLHAVHFDPFGSCGERDHEHVSSLNELVATL